MIQITQVLKNEINDFGALDGRDRAKLWMRAGAWEMK